MMLQKTLKYLVEEKGMKNKDVAEVIGVYPIDVTNIRNGKRNLMKRTEDRYMKRLLEAGLVGGEKKGFEVERVSLVEDVVKQINKLSSSEIRSILLKDES